jgi:hypothetical protein
MSKGKEKKKASKSPSLNESSASGEDGDVLREWFFVQVGGSKSKKSFVTLRDGLLEHFTRVDAKGEPQRRRGVVDVFKADVTLERGNCLRLVRGNEDIVELRAATNAQAETWEAAIREMKLNQSSVAPNGLGRRNTIAVRAKGKRKQKSMYLTLEGYVIDFYAAEKGGSTSLAGRIPLANTRAVVISGSDMRIITDDKVWELSVDSIEQAQEWASIVEMATEDWARHEAEVCTARAVLRLNTMERNSVESLAGMKSESSTDIVAWRTKDGDLLLEQSTLSFFPHEGVWARV